ncbi:MAG: hypothetical protein ACR2G3_04700 [Solirubrobacterales bacterium]
MSLAFLLCVERGPLEAQSLLCVSSLREFGGEHADAPVYAFAPRPGLGPQAATREAMAALDVELVDRPLNASHAEHPTWNKVYVAAWAERELDAQRLVFTDSDCAFVAAPSALAGGKWAAAAKPVGVARAASLGPGDGRAEEWWRRLYETLGIAAEPYVTTAVDRVRVRAYWNAGLLAVRREAGIFTAWEGALERLLDAGCVHAKPELMDQMAWAGAVAERHDEVWELPDAYNYPLPQRARLPEPARSLELDDLVHLHLHRWAHVEGFLDEVEPPLADSKRRRWLAARLPLEPRSDGSFARVQARRRKRADA